MTKDNKETGHYLVLSIPVEKDSHIDFMSFGNTSELPTRINNQPLDYYQGSGSRIIAIVWDLYGTSPIIRELKEHKVAGWEMINRD